jgi:hypothetical protein
MHHALHKQVSLATEDDRFSYLAPNGYKISTQNDLRDLLRSWLPHRNPKQPKIDVGLKQPSRPGKKAKDEKGGSSSLSKRKNACGVRLWRDFENLTLGSEGLVMGNATTAQIKNRL